MTDAAAAFERGVADYFAEFGHRQARELPHQTWLLISVARYISPQLIVAELQLPNRDLAELAGLRSSAGALNFDFAITRAEIDLRTWKRRTPDWMRGASTVAQSLENLREVAVLAEFKIADSSSTSTESLIVDIRKLSGAVRFLEQHRVETYPACYLVVLDPDRELDIDHAIASTRSSWPSCTDFPKVLTDGK